MKEKYFDANGISVQARTLLNSIGTPGKKEFTGLDISRSVLLVVDMQDYFLEKHSPAFIPSAPAVMPVILNLQNLFLDNNRPVVQTRHQNTPDDAGRMKEWWKRLLSPEDPLNRISPVFRDERARVMIKTQYDAFYRTGFYSWLADRQISQLVVTGVKTHLCCETTARSAFVSGFEVFFVVDGTATDNREFHRASLLNLCHGFAVPVFAREIQDCFSNLDDNES